MNGPSPLRSGASNLAPAANDDVSVDAALPDPSAAESLERRDVAPRWNPVKRALFRFLFSYLLLYIFPFPVYFLYFIPPVEALLQSYNELWNALVPWVGKRLFQVDITVFPNGSGDTTYNYVQVLCFAVLALLAAAVWTLLDRKRAGYARLNDWLRIYVRYSLAAAMISYGAVKVIKSQFPAPTLDRLVQSFGDASPMGLLWTLMGVSVSYNVFTGAGEMLGGLLLTSRRTTTLGALVSIGVLANIVMLNFSYDVPVKLYSTHLLAMAVFVLAPDLRRLADLFLFNRGVEAAETRPLFRRRWLDRGALALRTVLVIAFTAYSLYGAHQGRKTYGDLAPKPPLYGIWNVDQIEVDGKALPPLVTDETRWRRVVFDRPGLLVLQRMSGSRERYDLELDTAKRRLNLTKRDDPTLKSVLSYTQPAPGLLAIEGAFEGRKIRARLRRTEAADFLLLNRGFHWINEYPFNR